MSCHNIKKKSINKFENLNMNMENTLTNANHLTKKRQMRGSEKTKTELSKGGGGGEACQIKRKPRESF